MALRVRTNISSLVAQRHFGNSSREVAKRSERLASGKRINRAADDAAGLAISETLRATIRSTQQAKRNADDAVSMIQVAEGSLNEVSSILVRLRELAIQSASDTIGKREREYLNREFVLLKDEVDRIALSTEYNGTRLLTGRGEFPEALYENHNPFPAEIQVDTDYYPGVDSLEQPNPLNIIRIHFEDMNVRVGGEGSLEIGASYDEEGIRVDGKAEAQRSIAQLDAAFTKVSSYRATLGAIQNRIESASRTLDIRVESLSEAKSRIVDADFAFESAQYTQFNILQQAGASVLSQATQSPRVALQLLEGM